MASLLFPPLHQFCDSNGKPLNGGKVYIYDEGTTDDAAAFTDKALSSSATQPVVLDSSGRIANIYVASGQYYKTVLKTSADVTVATSDSIPPAISYGDATLPVASGGTGSTTASTARTALGAAAASDVSTLQTTIASIDGQISALPGGELGAAASQDIITPAYMSGQVICVQDYYTERTDTVSLGSIPMDGTVPQNTEGTQIFSYEFTPLYDDSVIEIECSGGILPGGTNMGVIALFLSSSTSAFHVATGFSITGGAYWMTINAKRRIDSWGTAPLTISARAGVTSGSTTAQMNPSFGTTDAGTFIIREFKTV